MNLVTTIVVAVLATLLEAWLVMLMIGAAHHADNRIPALGFAAVVWVVVAANIVIGTAVSNATQN